MSLKLANRRLMTPNLLLFGQLDVSLPQAGKTDSHVIICKRQRHTQTDNVYFLDALLHLKNPSAFQDLGVGLHPVSQSYFCGTFKTTAADQSATKIIK